MNKLKQKFTAQNFEEFVKFVKGDWKGEVVNSFYSEKIKQKFQDYYQLRYDELKRDIIEQWDLN